jgi:hypothetical protein
MGRQDASQERRFVGMHQSEWPQEAQGHAPGADGRANSMGRRSTAQQITLSF